MKSYHKIKFIPLVLIGLFTSACVPIEGGNGTKNSFLDGILPSVVFSHLEVKTIDFEHVESDFVFTVENPNPIGFSVDNFDYNLAFEQIDWANGDNPDGLQILPDDESLVALPVDIVWTELFDMVQALRGNDNIDFNLDGNFGVRLDSETILFQQQDAEVGAAGIDSIEEDAAGYVFDFPYDVLGDFPALRKPKLTFRKLVVEDWSLSEINLDLRMHVDNEHSSNLTFQRFAYNLQLGNTDIITGVAEELNDVIAGSSEEGTTEGDSDQSSFTSNQGNKTLNLPIKIDLTQAGQSILTLLQGNNNLNLSLNGEVDVDTPFGVATLSVDETGQIDVEF
jgi:LEA14-like dessication related protein